MMVSCPCLFCSDACVALGKPLVSAAAVGTDGQLTVYNCGEDGAFWNMIGMPALSLQHALPAALERHTLLLPQWWPSVDSTKMDWALCCSPISSAALVIDQSWKKFDLL